MKVLLVPDSVYWVTGTISRSIAGVNSWLTPTIVSGPLLDELSRILPTWPASFDLVHFICPYASKDWLPRLRTQLPVVTTHHHVTDFEHVKHNLDGDAVMTDSEQWVDDLVARGFPRERALSLPSGVDTRRFVPLDAAGRSAARARLQLPGDGPVIGFFAKKSSNEADRKGTDVFCAAVRELARMGGRPTVVIVGPGWNDLVASLRTEGIVCVWIPFVRENLGLAAMYPALDFYWVTARIEGGPVTLVEAMSCGVCCVTTPVGIAREIARDGVTAAVVPFDQPRLVAERTRLLWADATARTAMQIAARHEVESTMDIRVTARRAGELYARALAAFGARTGRAFATELPRLLAQSSRAGEPSELKDYPLAALPEREQRRFRENEAARWADHLIQYQGEHRAALALLARVWRRRPLSTAPGRVLLKNYLPPRLVSAVVSLKRAWRRSDN